MSNNELLLNIHDVYSMQHYMFAMGKNMVCFLGHFYKSPSIDQTTKSCMYIEHMFVVFDLLLMQDIIRDEK